MSAPIHDDEPDVSEPVVRALLDAERPEWAGLPIASLDTSGTDNAMWRVRTADPAEADVIVRLPRRPGAAAGVLTETATLRHLETSPIASIVRTPRVRHVGDPHDAFPHHWSVLEWLDGTDAWTARHELELAGADLAEAVSAIATTEIADARLREPGDRGGPLPPLLDRLDGWLDDLVWRAGDFIDVAAVRRLADEARELVDEPIDPVFVHGDLIPGNLLVDSAGRLSSIIDWGGAGVGDAAQDLAPAWAVLSAVERETFRSALGVDEATWIRGRTFELEHAVGGVLYYVPKGHALGDVMARTLHRILTVD